MLDILFSLNYFLLKKLIIIYIKIHIYYIFSNILYLNKIAIFTSSKCAKLIVGVAKYRIE